MSTREDLAGIIGGKLIMRSSMTETADAVLAAGYQRPRTVTTAQEIDALGASAVILDARGCVWVNDGDTEDPWASLVEQGEGPVWTSRPDLPVTVIHEPEAL